MPIIKTKSKRNEELRELIEIKQAFVNRKQPFDLFTKFVFKNLFLSVTNFLYILFLPLAVYVLCIYLYSPFSEIFPFLVLIPPIIIGVVVYSRAIFRYHQQSIFIKRISNYLMITLLYIIFSFIWSAIMFGLFIVVSIGFWNKGSPIQGTLQLSPTFFDYLKNTNWLSLLYTYFQVIVISLSIGLIIGLCSYRNSSIWIIILLVTTYVFVLILVSFPPIYRKMNDIVKWLVLINPFYGPSGLSLASFNGTPDVYLNTYILTGLFDPFKFDNILYLYNPSSKQCEEFFINTKIINLFNLFSWILYYVIAIIYVVLYSLWNKTIIKTFNKNNPLFFNLNKLSRASSFKTLFIGVPEYFKIDGMDDPHKNYIFYVEKPVYNKLVFDMLTNKVRMFKKDTVQFNDIKVLYEIQHVFFNDAVFSGLKVCDFLEYYKRLDFIRYQEIIKDFSFNRISKIRIEYLDYDSLFYLYTFVMIFNNKKIFLIDNYSLSKISSKVIDLIQKNNLNYWLVSNIKDN